MVEQPAQRDVGPGVRQAIDVFGDRVVQGDLPLVHEQQQAGGGECLAHGCDHE
jgi:hypothetical protein